MIRILTTLPIILFGYSAYAQPVPEGGCDYGAAIEKFESNGVAQPYSATNPSSTATGRYQLTYAALIEAGYIDGSRSSQPPPGAGEWKNVVWTGKGGVNSRADYMSSPEAQADSLEAFTAANLSYIKNTWDSSISVGGVQLTNGGVGVAAHMLGNGGWKKWASSGFSPSGLSLQTAIDHGYASVEEFQAHLQERLAGGGCADPGSISSDSFGDEGEQVQDLPEIFLMPWEGRQGNRAILPGQIRSNIQ